MTWGKLLEIRAFKQLPSIFYTLSSQVTDTHPRYSFWVGSKDVIKEEDFGLKTVGDIKCPMTVKSFYKLVLPSFLGMSGIDAINALRYGFTLQHDGKKRSFSAHPDAEKYYWQLISNACINDCQFAELIVYCPFQSELSDIKIMAEGFNNAMFITFASDSELPYVPDGGRFNNLYVIRFEVPEKDKLFLENRVKMAGELLIDVDNIKQYEYKIDYPKSDTTDSDNIDYIIAERDEKVKATIGSKPVSNMPTLLL